MDNPTYLAMLRRRLQDTATPELYDDPTLWAYTSDANLELVVRGGVHGFGVYTVTTTGTPLGFDQEPTTDDAILIMTVAAWRLLGDVYKGKVSRGELGGSWKSGLEEESTTVSQRAFQTLVDELGQRVEELTILRSKQVFASRKQ